MESDGEFEESMLVFALYRRRRKRKKQRRRIWVGPIFVKRKQQGSYNNLVQELRLTDPQSHFRYFRMSKEKFDCLLSKVNIYIIYIICVFLKINLLSIQS